MLRRVTQHEAGVDDGRQFTACADGVGVEDIDLDVMLGQMVLEQVGLYRVGGQIEGGGYWSPRFASTAFTGSSICVRSPTMTMTAWSGRPSAAKASRAAAASTA